MSLRPNLDDHCELAEVERMALVEPDLDVARPGRQSSMGECLVAGGVVQIAVWDACVPEVKAIVAQRVAELT